MPHARPSVILTCGVDIKDPSGHFASPTQSIGVVSLMLRSVTLSLGVCGGNSLLIREAEQERCQTRPSRQRFDGLTLSH